MKTKTTRIAIAASTAPNPREPKTITLNGVMKIDGFDGSEYPVLYLNGKEIYPRKSLKLASHFCGVGWGIDWNDVATSTKACLQTALAICIELYGVSNALKVYRDFSEKYLECCPFNQSFDKTITVEL